MTITVKKLDIGWLVICKTGKDTHTSAVIEEVDVIKTITRFMRIPTGNVLFKQE